MHYSNTRKIIALRYYLRVLFKISPIGTCEIVSANELFFHHQNEFLKRVN